MIIELINVKSYSVAGLRAIESGEEELFLRGLLVRSGK